MPFEFNNTAIDGIIVIKPHIYTDNRGCYKKYFEKKIFVEHGIICEFTESSDIYSEKGALRGLHYQSECSQAKLIRVVSGLLFDVALDLRPDSSTFGKYHVQYMDSKDNDIIFIPEGFAHGFIALKENTIFSYQCSGKYIPEKCGGILWNDTELAIPWPLKKYGINEVIATEKDKSWPSLREYMKRM